MGALGRMTYVSYLVAVVCSFSLLQAAIAWLPLTPPKAATGAVVAAAATMRRQAQQSTRLWSGAGEDDGGGERPDLAAMKRSFEGSMDNKLIMEYVMELRARKALLLSSLEATGGVITDGIYPIMEELARVNPSSGCGLGSDKGKSHYCAMLPGHWIAASTIVPNVPFVYGQGEKKSGGGRGGGGGSASSPSGGSGPTCTLGQLVAAISGRKDGAGVGDGAGGTGAGYDADAPVRPLRARISALNNTVKEGEMPTVVAIAGFSPAAEAVPSPAAGGGGGEERGDEVEKGAKVAIAEDGAVRGRGKWGVMGGYHLRWEFETMNLDLGGDKIVRAAGEGEEGIRDLYEFFLDQNLLILAWKDAPKKEDAIVFVRDEVPR